MLSLGFSIPPPKNTLARFPNKPFFSIISGGAPSKRNESNVGVSISHPKIGKVVASASNEYGEEKKRVLPAGLQPELMPKHVAVIMDGNRRWAAERDVPVEGAHRAGGRALRMLTTLCSKWGVETLTVFTFSTENWTRPKEEVAFLMKYFEEVMKSDIHEFLGVGARISVIGNRSLLPMSLQNLITQLEENTKANTGLHLISALNYSGRSDIMQACKSIANNLKDGLIQPQDINESLFERELETKCAEFPNPDLFIRTSGEHRLSNFMLWQLAYTELFFVDKRFPDFHEADFIEALCSFQKRQRRYGGNKG